MNRARYLRKRPTKWEPLLWRHLRNRNFAGYKFRRQHPIDPYVIDFYCPSATLAMELDGGGHNHGAGRRHDRTREEFLARQQGILVLRFWNHQVRDGRDSVLRAIWFALEKRAGRNPSPQSSPFEKGRGGSKRVQRTASLALRLAATRRHEKQVAADDSASPCSRGED